MGAGVQPVALATKMRPSQERARDTFETILTTTGDLLRDVGFERLSTNMICDRAGITPPALYRYFPNKYAIMKELGQRLMAVQDRVVFDWIADGGMEGGVPEREEKSFQLYRRVTEVTREYPGGMYITRVMRAIPILRDVRVDSSELVSQHVVDALHGRYPGLPLAKLHLVARLTTETGYAAIEVALEEPELEEEMLRETARMIVNYYETLLGI